MSTQNSVNGGTAETVIQTETTGPIHTGSGDQHAPLATFTGTNTGITVINGDMDGEISQTFN
ncbi:hypothetical protein [Streptomyces griseus]|uniref:hypothetical protein n=1 Tax=Streptomyces griseus TaxID=1911 RepID=UPI0033A8828F